MTVLKTKILVSAEWMQSNQPGLVIADVRAGFGGRTPYDDFSAGHIPGAVFVDLETDLADAAGPIVGRHPLPSPEHFAERLGQLGISATDHVVTYDDNHGVFAARLVWMLRALGQPASLLDGGLAAWPGPISTEHEPRAAVPVPRRPWPTDRLADAAEVESHIRSGGVVIDSRAASRYRGEHEPMDPLAGHIPGAINIDHMSNLNADGLHLDRTELRARFGAADTAGPDVIVYCGSGVTACHNALIMEHVGLGLPRVYIGSWSGWSSDPDRPIENHDIADFPEVALRPSRTVPFRAHPSTLPWPTENWPHGPLDDQVDQGRLGHLIDAAFGPNSHGDLGDTLAFVAVQGATVVSEHYHPGVNAETPLISWSMAKSVIHALLGILVGEQKLATNQRAPVPQWSEPGDRRHEITIEQLLTMTSGLSFNEDYDPDTGTSDVLEMLFGAGLPDMAAYAASKELVAEPGTVCSYSSGTTNILSGVIADTVGRDPAKVEAFIRDRLLTPIGMTTATPSLDDSGVFTGSSYLHASALDFAKFGYLYLRDGMWDGSRILPDGWANQARTPTEVDPGERFWYGHHWWIWPDEFAAFGAHGYEGQYLVVVPERDLVVVRLGKTPLETQPRAAAWVREVVRCFPPTTT